MEEGVGKGPKPFDREQAWSSINHWVLSAIDCNPVCRRVHHSEDRSDWQYCELCAKPFLFLSDLKAHLGRCQQGKSLAFRHQRLVFSLAVSIPVCEALPVPVWPEGAPGALPAGEKPRLQAPAVSSLPVSIPVREAFPVSVLPEGAPGALPAGEKRRLQAPAVSVLPCSIYQRCGSVFIVNGSGDRISKKFAGAQKAHSEEIMWNSLLFIFFLPFEAVKKLGFLLNMKKVRKFFEQTIFCNVVLDLF